MIFCEYEQSHRDGKSCIQDGRMIRAAVRGNFALWRRPELVIKVSLSGESERKKMNKKLAIEAGICGISFPVAVFFACRGYGQILWIYAAFVAGLGVIWVLQGLFRKSN